MKVIVKEVFLCYYKRSKQRIGLMKKYNYSERGRSMIEMMGYLAVMMSVVVAIGRIVSSAFDSHRYSTATLQVTELATSIVKAGAIDVDYSEILSDINGTNTMNLIPASFRRAGNKIFHVFGGEVLIAASPMKDPDCVIKEGEASTKCFRVDQFSVTFTKLSKKQCVELAMKNWQSNQYVDLYALSINNNDWWFWSAYGNKSGSPVSIEDGNCDDTGHTCVFPVKRSALTGTTGEGQCVEGDENSLTWVFN